jgi:hypothetical protein
MSRTAAVIGRISGKRIASDSVTIGRGSLHASIGYRYRMRSSSDDVEFELGVLRNQVRAMRRVVGVLAVAVVALAVRSIGSADAQPTVPPPAAKSIAFTDGDQHVELDASGLRITKPHAQLAITADRIYATAADPGKDGSTIELAVGAADAHVKALSELGSTALVATPKSLCVTIRQIGGRDSMTCIPPVK